MRRTPQALAPVVSTGVSLPGELWSKFAGVLRQSIDVRVERSSYRLADTNFYRFLQAQPAKPAGKLLVSLFRNEGAGCPLYLGGQNFHIEQI